MNTDLCAYYSYTRLIIVLITIIKDMESSSHINSTLFVYYRKTSDGILAKVGFHFRKSEHNPISHIRFIVSRGHLSNLKVDKHYFKILKTPGKFVSDVHKYL